MERMGLWHRRMKAAYCGFWNVGLLAVLLLSGRSAQSAGRALAEAAVHLRVLSYDQTLLSRNGNKLKIAVLYRADSAASRVAGVEMAKALKALAARVSVHGKTPVIIPLGAERMPSQPQLTALVREAGATVLYVAPDLDHNLVARTARALRLPTLCGDTALTRRGLSVGFSSDKGKGTVVINRSAAVAAGMDLTMELYKLATVIRNYTVIVNPANPLEQIERSDLEGMFLRRVSYWPNGVPVSPVDLPEVTGPREHFSTEVLGRTPRQIKALWRQRTFKGEGVPPPELKSDADVAGYVAKNKGAVGYVAPDAKIAGVKVVDVVE